MEEVSVINVHDRGKEEKPGHVGGCQLGTMAHTAVCIDDEDTENKEVGRTGTATLSQTHRGVRWGAAEGGFRFAKASPKEKPHSLERRQKHFDGRYRNAICA